MNLFLSFLMLLSLNIFASDQASPKPFSTDLCTLYREGPLRKPDAWKHCCVEHDLYFWAGGSLDDKKLTDLRLKKCVEASGYPAQAFLIYTAVTVTGASPIHIKAKQWGNAWDNRIRYLSLTENETSTLLQYLESRHYELAAKLKQSFKEQLNYRLDNK